MLSYFCASPKIARDVVNPKDKGCDESEDQGPVSHEESGVL